MDPLVLIPQHVRNLVCQEHPIPFELPKAINEDFSIVAIIDIAGYSKLSSKLEEALGSDSGAKIKELINPPMETITEHVHRHCGSIVKLAGDAVIASWTLESECDTPELEKHLAMNAFLCCLELLQVFQNYTIKVKLQNTIIAAGIAVEINSPDSSIHSTETVSFESNHRGSYNSTATNSNLNANLNAFARRISNQLMGNEPAPQVASAPVIPMFETTLAIHIGLALGPLQHIHVGVNKKGNSIPTVSRKDKKQSIDSSINIQRMEYFIAGEALAKAGENLNLGKNGDFVFNKSFNQILKESIKVSGMKVNNGAFIIGDKDPILDLRAKALQFTQTSEIKLSNMENQLPQPTSRKALYLEYAKAYMDDSISKLVGQGEQNVVMDQLRSVSVVFIKFGGFKSETVAEPENLMQLQSATAAIISKVKEYEGCIRQFNCDDKALTALLVWGLEGHAHEKGESQVAMLAATEIGKCLKQCLSDPEGFSIGVTTGVVFAGIVGSKERCDNTVLGVVVNNAARLMCLSLCQGRILCDEETYSQTADKFTYGTDIPPVTLKGVPNPVRIFYPMGSSGIGKTQMTLWLQNQISDKELVCVGAGQEHKKTNLLFTWTRVFVSFLDQIALSGTLLPSLQAYQESQEKDNDDNSLNDALLHHRYTVEANDAYNEYISRNHQSTSRGRSRQDSSTIPRIGDTLTTIRLDASDIQRRILPKFPRVLQQLVSLVNLPVEHIDALVPITDTAIDFITVNVNGMACALSEIFNAFNHIGLKICIVLDDIHWCDSFSLELIKHLLSKCKHVLFVFSARPLEEWSPVVSEQFQRILEEPDLQVINVGALNAYGIENMLRDRLTAQGTLKFTSVNLDIVREILDKGQGNPMVTDILINSLIESSLLCVKGGCLTRAEGKELQLGMGSTAAVVAQFDKLSAPMKAILRVFAMAGQIFKLTEICLVMQRLSETMGEDFGVNITCDAITELIRAEDKYKFIKSMDDKCELGFSHYLIQQGIISGMVPSKRDSIRNAFVACYEEEVRNANNPAEKASLRQSLIYHLLKISGHGDKKKYHIYEAFIETGENNQVTESLAYFETLPSFDSNLDFADTCYKKLKECRILSKLYFEKRDIEKSITFGQQGLLVLGCSKNILKPNLVFMGFRIYTMINQVLKIIDTKNTEEEMVSRAKRVFHKQFPKAHSSSEPKEQDENNDIMKETADLIMNLIATNEHTRPSLELFLLSLLLTTPSILSKKHTLYYRCQVFSLLSVAGKLLTFDKLYEISTKRANSYFASIYSEENQTTITPYESKILSHVHEVAGHLAVLERNYSLAVVLQRNGFLLLANRGLGSTEKAFMLWQASRINVQRMGHHEEILRQWFEERDCKYYHKAVNPFFLAESTSYVASALANLNESVMAEVFSGDYVFMEQQRSPIHPPSQESDRLDY
ncbi:adenylyl cyclase [Rhizoclosmatium globosum]|uniref:Adenylyl cyclase n=1 Tax=Rhizoclosmatium globosum TaxID=329046 RepID=A0A1Y2C768_9FUNG|nr:adenylyl cyclase [Rhizoclosmatium globosum]|eukprot:ORY42747.1 adenylyl cyclase [Rhizoclosmatium globosum]